MEFPSQAKNNRGWESNPIISYYKYFRYACKILFSAHWDSRRMRRWPGQPIQVALESEWRKSPFRSAAW